MSETPVKSVFSNFKTQIILTVLNLLIGILVTRQLGAELKGQYNALLLVTSFYAPMLLFGYTNGVLFYGLKKVILIKRFFWKSTAFIALLSLLITFLLYVLIQYGVFGNLIQSASLKNKILLLSSVPPLLLNGYFDKVLRASRIFVATNNRMMISTFFLGIYFLLTYLAFGSINLSLALLGLILSQCLQVALNIFYIQRKLNPIFHLKKVNLFKPWDYGIKVWINQIISKSNDKFDQLILSFLMVKSSFGVYVVGVAFCNLLSRLPSSYINVFYNQMIGKDQVAQIQLFERIQRLTFLIIFSLSIFLLFVSGWIIPALYGSNFNESVVVVYFYLPGLLFQILGRFNIKFYSSLGLPLKNSIIYLIGILVSLPFYFLLVPKLGIRGAAISSTIAYLASYLFSFYQLKRDYNLKLANSIVFKKTDFNYWSEQLNKIRTKKNSNIG